MSRSGWATLLVAAGVGGWTAYHAATTGLMVPSEVARVEALLHSSPAGPPLVAWVGRAAATVWGHSCWSARSPQLLWLALLCFSISSTLAVVDRRAALYSVCVLLSMPSVLLQAQTSMGDLAPAAAAALAFCGWACGVLGLVQSRWKSAVIAVVSTAVSVAIGGLWTGAGIPLLSVGAAWVSWGPDRKHRAVEGIACLALAMVVVFGVGALGSAASTWWMGGPRDSHAALTFEIPWTAALHGMAPWSALVPFAAAASTLSGASRRSSALAVGMMVAIVVSMASCSAASHWTTTPALVVAPFAAGILAVAMRRLDATQRGWEAWGLATVLIGAVLVHDFGALPHTMLRGMGAGDLAISSAVGEKGALAWKVGCGAFAAVVVLTLGARSPHRVLWDRQRYVQTARAVAAAPGVGRLWGSTVVAIAVGALLVAWGARSAAPWIPSSPLRTALCHAVWLSMVGPVVLVLGALVVGDATEALVRSVFSSCRGGLLACVGSSIAFGVVAWVYPSTIRSMSATAVSERVGREPRAQVGSLGVDPAVHRWAGVRVDQRFPDAATAHSWLVEPNSTGRLLIASADNLVALNRLHRSFNHHTRNLTALAASDSILLLSAVADSAAVATNPLDRVLLNEEPAPRIRLDVVLDNRVELVGIDLVDPSKGPTTQLWAGRRYVARTYYRLLRNVDDGWKAFVHIDGRGRRHNADHVLLQGMYPMSSLGAGDVIVDEFDIVLPLSTPPGKYGMFVGLFRDDDTRMSVSRGAHESDGRVRAAELVVM